ncbi:coenzyme f420-0:l-glutamate ligase [hydrocarbon metagenome]|uniref:Coenzyme f420-0:l-glutamate ligase n=1 Tax=hydrocarbon metagenome TaxID=938273 RepID=A0A0W8FER5_9ZZZZ|nr:coenzyme F420-0:L-glutamate ligase [Methanomicrobiaceae archaeon]
MNGDSFWVSGLKTGLIRPGDEIVDHLVAACEGGPCRHFMDGDILVIAESAVATAEGRVVPLERIEPGEQARALAERYRMDPRVVELVLAESEIVIGGIEGFLLSMKNGTLLPNAGIDASNAPPGTVILLPEDPDRSAERIRRVIARRCNADVGVIIADSRTHPMRLGSAGVAIGCSGICPVADERGRRDLFGRELHVTRRAVADCLSSAAELVMGEADECTPAAVVRGSGLPIRDYTGIETIDASECLFMGIALHADPALLDRERKP